MLLAPASIHACSQHLNQRRKSLGGLAPATAVALTVCEIFSYFLLNEMRDTLDLLEKPRTNINIQKITRPNINNPRKTNKHKKVP